VAAAGISWAGDGDIVARAASASKGRSSGSRNPPVGETGGEAVGERGAGSGPPRVEGRHTQDRGIWMKIDSGGGASAYGLTLGLGFNFGGGGGSFEGQGISLNPSVLASDSSACTGGEWCTFFREGSLGIRERGGGGRTAVASSVPCARGDAV
jgi:hypothetical protein